MSATSTNRINGKTSRYLANASHLALVVGCAVLANLAAPAPVKAAFLDWTGTASADWFTAGNWNSGTVPTAGDDVGIGSSVLNAPAINGGVASARYLYIGSGGSQAMVISNGGSLTSDAAEVGSGMGGTGTVTVTGSGAVWNAQGMGVGLLGTGTLNVLNGGTVDTMPLATTIGYNTTGVGTVNVDGAGSLLRSSNVVVGRYGVGALTVTNGGAVLSTSFTTYVGQFAGSVGAVTVSGQGSQFTVASNAIVIGEEGNGTVTLANGGTLSVSGSTLVGFQAGAVGTINIGGAIGAAPQAPGTLNSAVVFLGGNGTGVINFNHTSSNYIFDPEIFGTGSINQIAGTTIITGDAHGLTGATNVTGGRLAVNSSLGSMVNVSGGGILGGTGTVGGINAISGGIIAPGNSIGTLNVAGNVNFSAGSIYQVETNAAGQSDKVAATGTATLNGGTVVATGTAPIGTKYTILTAAGGISGVFAGATGAGALPFIGYGLTYDATNVYLSFGRSSLVFASVGLTRNQIAAGSGADSLPLGSPLVGSLVQLDLAQAGAAFDQLSGEVHASAKGVMIEDSRFVREAATDRLRSAFDGVGAVAAPVTAYVDGKPVFAAATTDSLAVWGRGFGSWGQWNGDGNAATIKRDIGGFMIGADATALDGWRLGMLGGYSRSNFRVGDRSSSGTSDNYHVGLYGGTQWGDFAFRSGLAFTRHELSTSRTTAFPGFTDMLKADYGAGTTQGFGELGYRIRAGRTSLGMLAFEPFGNLAYVHLSTDGFIERGGNAALTGRSDDTGVTFTTLGVRSSLGGQLDNGMTTLARGTLGWRHAFGDVTPVSILSFTGGSQFSVAGVPIARDGAVMDLGFDINVSPSAVLGLSYGGQLGSGATDHSVRGNFALKF